MAEGVWQEISERWPEILGPVNPHNDEIRQLFGDQGGY